MNLALEASWAPLAALIVGGMMALLVLKIIGAVYSQALEHYTLALEARKLRRSHLERLREIDHAIKRENAARTARNQERNALLHGPQGGSDGAIGVDILEAA